MTTKTKTTFLCRHEYDRAVRNHGDWTAEKFPTFTTEWTLNGVHVTGPTNDILQLVIYAEEDHISG